MKELEARLGVQLLRRTTRHVAPTLDGEGYYQRCLRLLADLDDAEAAFADAEPRGMLHINVHGTLASHWVLPKLPEFLARHPGIEMVFSEGDRYVDLLREGVDCVLRVGNLADSDLIVRRVATLEEATCVSPSYVARHGLPERFDALDGHRMVGFRSSAIDAVLPLEFTVGTEVRAVMLPTSITVSGADIYAAAARAGLGLIQAPRYRLEEDIRCGRLLPVLARTPPTPLPVSVLYPRTRQLTPRLRVFIDWLAAQFRGAPAGG